MFKLCLSWLTTVFNVCQTVIDLFYSCVLVGFKLFLSCVKLCLLVFHWVSTVSFRLCSSCVQVVVEPMFSCLKAVFELFWAMFKVLI